MGDKEYGVQWGRLLGAFSVEHIKKGYRYLKRHGLKQFLIRLIERFQSQDIDYETWFGLNKVPEGELERQKSVVFEKPVKISIVVPLYQTPERFLREMIESVCSQTYGNWELCLADASPLTEQDKKSSAGRKEDRSTKLSGIVKEYMRD